MELSHEKNQKLKELMAKMECKKDFECYKHKFENFCDGKLVGEQFVKCERSSFECSEKKFQSCDFSVSFGYGFFCSCPIRIYVAKNFNQ